MYEIFVFIGKRQSDTLIIILCHHWKSLSWYRFGSITIPFLFFPSFLYLSLPTTPHSHLKILACRKWCDLWLSYYTVLCRWSLSFIYLYKIRRPLLKKIKTKNSKASSRHFTCLRFPCPSFSAHPQCSNHSDSDDQSFQRNLGLSWVRRIWVGSAQSPGQNHGELVWENKQTNRQKQPKAQSGQLPTTSELYQSDLLFVSLFLCLPF